MKRSILAFGVLSHFGNLKESKHSDGHGGAGHSHSSHGNHGSYNSHGSHGSSEQAASHFKASFTFATGAAKANENAELNIQITDNGGNLVKDFEFPERRELQVLCGYPSKGRIEHYAQ